MSELTPRHNLKVRAKCWHARFRRCSQGQDRAPTITKCAAPQSSERQRGGLAIYPVSRRLVRRLLIELLMSSDWPYGTDDPDQQCQQRLNKRGRQLMRPLSFSVHHQWR